MIVLCNLRFLHCKHGFETFQGTVEFSFLIQILGEIFRRKVLSDAVLCLWYSVRCLEYCGLTIFSKQIVAFVLALRQQNEKRQPLE